MTAVIVDSYSSDNSDSRVATVVTVQYAVTLETVVREATV